MNPFYIHLLAIAIVVALVFGAIGFFYIAPKVVKWWQRKQLRKERDEMEAKVIQMGEIDEPFTRISDFGRN